MMKLCAVEDWDAETASCLREASEERALLVFTKAHLAAADEGSTEENSRQQVKGRRRR